jgi:hypothetical protein
MKRTLLRILPYAVGIAIGLAFAHFIFNPPELLRSWGLAGLLILPISFVLLIFIFLPGFSFARYIFKDTQIVPVERDIGRKTVRLLAEKLDALGFKPAGDALKFSTSTLALGFLREDIAVYGVIVRVEVGIGKTTLCFVSQMKDGSIGLLTAEGRNVALLPHKPGSLCQVFPGLELEELLLEHLRGVEWLHSQGLTTQAVSGEMFIENERKGLEELKKFLRSDWFRHTLVFVWRYISRRSPHLVPIERQETAIEYVRQFACAPAVTAESQARHKMMEQLRAVPVVLVHSGLGIASFVISLVVGLLEIIALIFLVILMAIGEKRSGQCRVIGGVVALMMVLLGPLGYIMGLAFGIVSAFEKRRKKIFSVLGIVLNAIGLALFIALLVVASMMRLK